MIASFDPSTIAARCCWRLSGELIVVRFCPISLEFYIETRTVQLRERLVGAFPDPRT